MVWKHPRDVRLSLIDRVKIFCSVIAGLFNALDEEVLGAMALLSVIFLLQFAWFLILKHNSAANTASIIAIFGSICAAFFLSIITMASFAFMIFAIAKMWETVKGNIIESYKEKADSRKQELYEKVDKDLLGSDHEL
jgi:predicted membrane protein